MSIQHPARNPTHAVGNQGATLQTSPQHIQHSRLRYETHSQAGVYSVMGMKGNHSTFPVVKELRLLCAEHDVELDATWRPRTDPHQQIPDPWSTVKDQSDWSLHPAVYEQLIKDPVLSGRTMYETFVLSFSGVCWGCFLFLVQDFLSSAAMNCCASLSVFLFTSTVG